MVKAWRAHLSATWTASAAALANAPENAAYGLLAMAPLGAAFGPQAMMLALIGAVVANLVANLLGAGRLVSGPRASLALLTSALVTALTSAPQTTSPGTVVGLVALALLAASGLQTFFGLLRLGQIVRYTPHPVRVGLMSGIGLLLAGTALPVLMGSGFGTGLVVGLQQVQPGAVIVGSAAAGLAWLAHRLGMKLPPMLLGLAGAGLLHAALSRWAPALPAGGFIGVPALGDHWFSQAPQMMSGALWTPALLALLTSYALTVALIGSLDTLVTVSVVDGQLRTSRNANRELVAQGLANVAVAVAGGQATSPSVVRSLEVVKNHPAHRHIVLAYALALAALISLGPELLGLLPASAIAGVLLYQGVNLVSPTLVSAPFLLMRQRAPGTVTGQRRQLAANWAVAASVTTAALALGLGWAVLVGGSFAVLLFVRANMREVISRAWTLRTRRSLKLRSTAATDALTAHGDSVVVYELEGSLFFGTADALRARLKSLGPHAEAVILDLHQVREVDVTAARILVETAEDFALVGRRLTFTEWSAGDARRLVVEAAANTQQRGLLQFADFVDDALEAAEDHLLARLGAVAPSAKEALPLSKTALAQGLDDQELGYLAAQLTEVRLQRGQVLFGIGQVGDALFVSRQGDIGLRLPGTTRRLASFAPGVTLGEMAVLTRGLRSAEAFAETEVLAWKLSAQGLEHLISTQPALGAKLLRNLLLHLGDRLRVVTGELAEWVSRSASGHARRQAAPLALPDPLEPTG